MTVTDRAAATEQEFRDRVQPIEAAPTPPEVREAAVANAILRAVLGDTDGGLVLDGDLPAAEIARLIVEHGAAAAVAAYRAQDGATCGDLSPSINFEGVAAAPRLMCELPFGHGGAHQHGNGDGLPPTRWIATQDGGAEEFDDRYDLATDLAAVDPS